MRRPLRLGTEGGSAIEFAVALPVVLMLLFGAFEFGRLMWLRSTIEQGVAAAGRYALAHPTASAATVASFAKSSMYGIDTTDVAVTATQEPGAVSYMTVTADYDFYFLGPFLPAGPVHLSSKARVPLL